MVWTDTTQENFENPKLSLVINIVLRQPNIAEPFAMAIVISRLGIGGVF